MEISDLCCKNSIWRVDSDSCDQGRVDFQGKIFTAGAIVQSIGQKCNERIGMVIYLSGMGDCCMSDLRKKASHTNGHSWRKFADELKLISESPLTKNQYEKLKEKDFYNIELKENFGDLNLIHLYIFGNPEKEKEIEGNLLYELGSKRNFVSWFSGKDSLRIEKGLYMEKRFVKPLNPETGKLLSKFHDSKYIDSLIKESIVSGITDKECDLTEFPF